MHFFSKLVFICNGCFIVSVVMHFVEAGHNGIAKTDTAVPLQFAEGTIAVLGLISLLVNAIFCIVFAGLATAKKTKQIPLWIVIFNFIALLGEVYWYFIDK